MNVSKEAIPEGSHNVHHVALEPDPDNGLHEAFVALNAIGARNRSTFEEVFSPRTEPGDLGKLREATADLLGSGMDKFTATVQKLARLNSREGVLTEVIKVRATYSNLDYLHNALTGYRDTTASAVLSEMNNVMGNAAALNRTMELVTVERMIDEICTKVTVTEPFNRESHPIGFGRVLIDTHEV